MLKETLRPLDGVRAVEANLMAAKITVTHNDSVTPEKLIAIIRPTGMEAQLAERGQKFGSGASAQRQRAFTVALSGALPGLGLILQWTNTEPPALRIAIFAGAIVAGGWFIFPKAFILKLSGNCAPWPSIRRGRSPKANRECSALSPSMAKARAT